MSFLGILKKVMGSNSSSLKEPKFVKEFTTENKNILNLQELLKETKDEETANSIKHNINRLYYGLIGERNVGLMSISWTQKVKLFYAVLLANNSHCSGVM